MEKLYLRYKAWSKTWSRSQLTFLGTVVFVLLAMLLIVSSRLDQARVIINMEIKGQAK